MEDTRVHSVSTKLHESNNLKDLKQMINNTRVKFADNIGYTLRDTDGNERNILFKEFADDIDYLGTALISIGLKGKRIAVISENRYEWEVTYLATVNGTGIIVPLDRSLPENEIVSLIERSEVEAVFFSKKYEPAMKKVLDSNFNKVKYLISMDLEKRDGNIFSQKELIELGKELIANGDRNFIDAEIDNKAMSIILFTSGTTSMSKAVMLSHENVCTNLNDITTIFDLTEKDTCLSFLPLHHTFECTVGFLYPVSVGTRIVFCRGLRHIAEDITLNQISVMISVPALFENLYKNVVKGIEKEGKLKKFQFGLKLSSMLMKIGIDRRRKIFKDIHEKLGGKLRLFVAGAAAFDPEIEEKLNALGIETYQGYGATENSPVIAAEHRTCSRSGSVGKLMPSLEGKLVDINENGIGEFVIKGPSVMMGYYNNEDATNEALHDGWLYTGDLGYFDKDDYMFITGRKKNVIVLKNGKNIYPEELEALINKLPGVKESFVFGRPDKNDDTDLKLGVKICYDKTIMKNAFSLEDEEEIREKLWKEVKEINKTMPKYKYIKELLLTTEEFEKTTTQKIKRFEEIKKI